MNSNLELLEEFLIEAFEGLDNLDQQFVELESDPDNKDLINSIFRTVHTIKGTSGFLELSKLESLTHKGENLLDEIRNGNVALTQDRITALLEMLDAIRNIMESLEANHTEGEEDFTELINRLRPEHGEGASAAPQAEQAKKAESSASEVTETELKTDFNPDAILTADELASTLEEAGIDPAALLTGSETASEANASNEQEEPGTPHVAEADDVTNHELLAELLGEEAAGQSAHDTAEEKPAADAEDHTNYELLAELLGEETVEKTKEAAAAAPSKPAEAAADEADVTNYELLAELMGEEDPAPPKKETEPTEAESTASSEPQAAAEVEDHTNHELLAELLGEQEPPKEQETAGAAVVKKEETGEVVTPQETKAVPLEKPATNSTASSAEKKEVETGEQKVTTKTSDKPTQTEAKAAPAKAAKGGGSIAETSIRVDVGLLDQLMNLVGELVLARNQILQFTKSNTDANLLNTTQRLNLITSELQESVMKTRMQPIANVWNKFPRVVRDIAKLCEKDVTLEMEGQETELDKTILEAIKDPLTHIVRNSVDHGVETPEVREANGKSPQGTVLLRAGHEGGHVIIEIIDDGAGMNTERIKQKALEKGIVSAERLASMRPQEIHRLVFAPGFSTAEAITNISGRGVGMDVVRSNIEKIGGTVDIVSVAGEGSTIMIKIPLTLAIIPALIVTNGDNRFAIPQTSLVELVSVSNEQKNAGIERIRDKVFYRLRGDLLPLIFLDEQLELQSAQERDYQSIDNLNIVVIKANDQQLGVVVKEVHDTEEIVVKPLGKQLSQIDLFAGATIMGDGKVALILDVLGLANRTNAVGDSDSLATEDACNAGDASNEKTTLLYARVGSEYSVVIPLVLVNRLEEVPIGKIESANGHPVMQYREGILPLIDLASFFKVPKSTEEVDKKHVVVHNVGGVLVGLMLDEIMDILEEHVSIQQLQTRTGIAGSAILQGRVTDILSVPEIIENSGLALGDSETVEISGGAQL